MTFKLIDLFAGPGGLGEGFASLNDGSTFKIGVSAEMESSAHRTLTLRSLFRSIRQDGDSRSLNRYYEYCNDPEAEHPEISLPTAWRKASAEANRLTLGDVADNALLDAIVKKEKLIGDDIVVIGGPPCQAYSLMGRAKNKGTLGYVAEDDHRHYLYKQYLRTLHKSQPTVFVMENVKGILSSQVGGRQVFHDILRDLTDPSAALGHGKGIRYTIHSLVVNSKFVFDQDPSTVDAHDFIVRAEEHGLPQARHRVILLGVREEKNYNGEFLLNQQPGLMVEDAIKGLPKLRSKLSSNDSAEEWKSTVSRIGLEIAADARRYHRDKIAEELEKSIKRIKSNLTFGDVRVGKEEKNINNTEYNLWVNDANLHVWLNHQARSHMDADLGRYIYASVFSRINKRSPKGHAEFDLRNLAPAHANWTTGKFADRFRVQRYGAPSSTITSHIAKDGHYFIHPDPQQCRSLTVREAARLQTFPDNYFFQGNRTQQYHQVGNAVPPLLASKIAEIVSKITK